MKDVWNFALIGTLGLAALAMPGCAQLSRVLDSTAETVGKGVTEFCGLPQDSRDQFTATANKVAAPNGVAITCAR